MITLLHGEGVGAGKSYLCLWAILEKLLEGGTVVITSTFALHVEKVREWFRSVHRVELQDDAIVQIAEADSYRIHELVPQGTAECPVLLVLDEAQGEFNARDWADKSKRAFFLWLTQSRHDDVDVLISTQNVYNVDKQFLRLVTNVRTVRNQALLKILGCFYYKPDFFWERVLLPDLKTQISARWLRKDKAVFALYDSKAMRGKHRKESVCVLKRKLVKVRSHRMKIILFLVFLGIGGAALAAWNVSRKLSGKSPGPAQTVAAAAAPVSVAAASAKKGGLPVPRISETFRGTDGRSFLHTDSGQYIVGDMSAHGYVVSIRGRNAVVRADDGTFVLVCAVPEVSRAVAGHGVQSRLAIVPPESTTPPLPTIVEQMRRAGKIESKEKSEK